MMSRPIYFLLLICLSLCTYAALPEAYVAVFYGKENPPELKFYKQVIVQPDSPLNPKQFDTPYRKAFVYVSLGEAYSEQINGNLLEKNWILGKNPHWNTLIIDVANPAWRQFYLEQVIKPLWDKGYRGFYLDTLDSYRLVMSNKADIQRQQDGLISLIKSIKSTYPDAKLILNRGFELLAQVHTEISRITVESVFSGWNNAKGSYFFVNPEQRALVIKEIKRAQGLGIPVTIIDYLPPKLKGSAEKIAKKIIALGCQPWITNHNLTAIYLSNFEHIPRKVLILYRGKLNNPDERLGSPAIKDLSMPLNYLGYAIETYNINEPLPKNLSKKDYAGIIISIDGILMGREHALYTWYLEQINKRIPLLVLNDFGFMVSDERLRPFGLSFPLLTHKPHTIKIIAQSPMIGFELQPVIKAYNFIPIHVKKGKGKGLFRVQDDVNLQTDIASITPWGGYYIGSSFLPNVSPGEYRWAINPFDFFKQALNLQDFPIPDTTTENGMRLMFTHIDGDGFSNKGEWYGAPFAGEIMRKEILERYNLPTTVSVIEGEISAQGLHPKDANTLERIAKDIFARQNVEIASHTFSHPYNWHDAETYHGAKINPYHLPIPNYQFNLKREINGSVEYINNTLAPKNKKCTVFLWSGEGDISERALKMVHQLGLRNLNPGTIITQYNPSLTRVSALGVNEGAYFQVFAPIGNDKEAQGSGSDRIFYSLINIIHALELTDKPKRLKPIDIYIHFFTLAQPGGIKALHAVYKWALQTPNMPIYASEYIDKVTDFNQLIISKQNDGWNIATNDALREFRIPKSLGFPDLVNSHNIVGFNDYNDAHYIHIGPGGEAFLKLTTIAPKSPYLVSSNARITRFTKTEKTMRFEFLGHTPIEFTLAHVKHCIVLQNQKAIAPVRLHPHQQFYQLQHTLNAEVLIQCP